MNAHSDTTNAGPGKSPSIENSSAEANRARTSGSKTISRAITYIGAIIIFVTFIIKDVIRERLKDLNDSINSAEMFYLNQSSISATQLQMTDVEMTVGTVNFNVVDQKAGELVRYQHQMKLVFGTLQDKTSITEQYMKNLGRLIQNLPHDESEQKQVDSLLASCAQLKSQAQAIPAEFDALMKKYNPDMDEDAEIPRGAMSKFNAFLKKDQSFEHDAATLGASVKALTDSVLANAHRLEAKGSQQYSRSTVWSYVLYSLGWGLAFVGKVFFDTGEQEEAG